VYLICGPVNYAMLQATIEFGGRNWRRLKREQNKAAKRARQYSRAVRDWKARGLNVLDGAVPIYPQR
jgi:hypothetical protein